MENKNKVNSLVLTSDKTSLLEIFLFQVLRYYTSNGLRVVYIAPKPISCLPPTIQDSEVLSDPEIMRLVSFHYISEKAELLEYLTTLNKAHKPPSTIIVQNMERYCDTSDPGLVCTITINAASMCSSSSGIPCNLVISFEGPLPPTGLYSFFHNVWCIHDKDNNSVEVHNLNPIINQPAKFVLSFVENYSRLVISNAFRVIKKKKNSPDR